MGVNHVCMKANLRLLQGHHPRLRKVLCLSNVVRDEDVLDRQYYQDADVPSNYHQIIRTFQTVTNKVARPKTNDIQPLEIMGWIGKLCS